LLLACAIGVGYPLWWMHRSEVGGQALLAHARQREGLTHRTGARSGGPPLKSACRPVRTRTGELVPRLPAILTIPAIGLEAPVLQGAEDSVLNDAVGHDRASVWPGSRGTSILLAHDASYFSSLGSVRIGDLVSWIDDCRRVIFRVDRVEVTRPGAILAAAPNGVGVALVTCWPTNALFWTPDRLVVLASFLRADATQSRSLARPTPLDIALPVPAAVASQGLQLSQNGLLVGHLRLAGRPTRSWAEGADPLRAARIAFKELAAVRITIAAGDERWWSALALPGVPMPRSLTVSGEFDAIVTVHGTRVRAVTLASPSATVGFVVRSGRLYVAEVSSA
jgi:sortase A